MAKDRPKVGLAVILMDYHNQSVLLGKRKNAHGEGTLSFPGGHLEKFEKFHDCIKREMKEETGLNADDYFLKDNFPCAVTNDFFSDEGKHYITLFFRANANANYQPKVMEPNKCEEWGWYEWRRLDNCNLFLPIKNLIKQNYNPFTS